MYTYKKCKHWKGMLSVWTGDSLNLLNTRIVEACYMESNINIHIPLADFILIESCRKNIIMIFTFHISSWRTIWIFIRYISLLVYWKITRSGKGCLSQLIFIILGPSWLQWDVQVCICLKMHRDFFDTRQSTLGVINVKI